MAEQGKKLIRNNKFVIVLKILVCLLATFCIVVGFFSNGLEKYWQETLYNEQNEFEEADAMYADLSFPVRQSFSAQGQRLTEISIYISRVKNTDAVLNISLLDAPGTVLTSINVNAKDLDAGEWNSVSINAEGLKEGGIYTLVLSTNDGAEGISVVLDSKTDDLPNLENCEYGGEEMNARLAIDIQQVSSFLSVGHGFRMGMDICFVLILLAVVIFTVANFETCYAAFLNRNGKAVWLYAAVLSGYFLLLFDPMNVANTAIQAFSRQIGEGVISGYDVSRAISNFTLWFFAFAFLFAIMLLFISRLKIREYTFEQKNAWKFLDNFIIIAGINVVLRGVTFFSDNATESEVFYVSTYLIEIILIFSFVYIIWKLDRNLKFDMFFSVLILAFSVSYPMAALLKIHWDNGLLLLGIQAIVMTLAVVLIKFVKSLNLFFQERHTFLFSATIVASLLPLALSFYLELVNVLTTRGIYIGHPRKYYAFSVAIMVVVMFLLFVVLQKVKRPIFDEKKLAFPFLIIGVVALSIQLPLTGTFEVDMYESANYGVLISDFLNFGDLPIITHYGGHMMANVWEGILYGLANGNNFNAALSPYAVYITPLIMLLFFFLLGRIWDVKNAFWAVLLLPIYDSISTYGWALLIILAVFAFVKKNTYMRASLIWLACVWCLLYKLDLGYAFIIACVVVLACYIIHEKNWKALKPLLLTLAGCIVVFAGLWVILCIYSGVNPLTRLIEFLSISFSNENWAYNGIGDPGTFTYFWHYLLLPFVVEGSLLYVIFSKKFKKKVGTVRWCLLIILGTAYFANFSRGLVRHSLEENALLLMVWTAYIYLAVFISCWAGEKAFMPAFFAFVLINSVFLGDPDYPGVAPTDQNGERMSNLLDSWFDPQAGYGDASSRGSGQTYWEQIKQDQTEVVRFSLAKDERDQMFPMREIVDLLLEDDETYVDFMNRTFTYAYLQKEDPVYVSQSPLQLSGEFSQEQFIREISEGNCPIVILPYQNSNEMNESGLDGIENTVRYYKVAEYLYQNYVPLCYCDDYAVWCLHDRYDEFLSRIDFTECECLNMFTEHESDIDVHDAEVSTDLYGLTIQGTGSDPYLSNLDQFLPMEDYIGEYMEITIEYQTDKDGVMEIYYTYSEGENFTSSRCKSCEISVDGGIAKFDLPVTEYTRIRLDTPEESTVTLTSVYLTSAIQPISYGYDLFSDITDKGDLIDESRSLHIYDLVKLAQIWGEIDTENAVENPVEADVICEGDSYRFDGVSNIDKTQGNYLHIKTSCAGNSSADFSGESDRPILATIRMGVMQDGNFIEKYRYTLDIEEGSHDYLIRISNDYFWYAENIDTIVLDCNANLQETEMWILQGD